MRLKPPDISLYVEKLKDGDKKPFENSYREKLDSLDRNEVKSIISTKLYEERQHVELVKAVASGFCSDGDGSDSQFVFNSTDPLSSVSTTGADVLLVRKQPKKIHLCVVLAEIGDENVPKWIENTNDTHQMLSKTEHQEEILSQIGLSSRTVGDIYYAIVARPTDLQDVQFGEIDRSAEVENLAIWSCDLDENNEICLEYSSKLHHDLHKLLDDCFDWALSQNLIEYTIETHPIIPIESVLYRIVRGNTKYANDTHPLEFNRDEFKERYEEQLQIWSTGSKKRRTVEEKVSEMIKLAKQIGIIKTDSDSVRDYRISYRGGNNGLAAKDAAESKFLDLATEVRCKNLAFKSAKEDFDSLQSGLGDFVDAPQDSAGSSIGLFD